VARRSLKESVKSLSSEHRAFLKGRPAKESQAEPEKQRLTEVKKEWPTITVKLHPHLALNLRVAAAQRKMQKKEPYTQEHIAQTAIETYLRDEGHWTDEQE
jgi:hypothetical protein